MDNFDTYSFLENTVNEQLAFDTVAKHLLAQKEQCTDDHGGCRYRNEKGQKCAIGCLIPDSQYRPELEGEKISCTSVQAAIGPEFQAASLELMGNLQEIHDDYDPSEWRVALRGVAFYHTLDTAVLD
jgi:hypothetical protein